jgi:putative GTP pyrophosphokinase
MKQPTLTAAQLRLIDSLVQYYRDNQLSFTGLLNQLTSFVETSKQLPKLAHSVKGRIKDPDHLRAKLIRKGLEAKARGEKFPYSKENLFSKVNDLAGFRILHLHTKQIDAINRELLKIFDEQRWVKLEGPSARTWDDESRKYFKTIGIDTETSETMYTSVHYIVQPNSKSGLTCEIQVRTLMEEVWGEVDHKINYPEKADSLSCREQIKVLARVTSSCSRLVDSIFLAHEEIAPIDSAKTAAKTKISKKAQPPNDVASLIN